MGQSKKDWSESLDVYGSNFNRWPTPLSEQQKQEVRKMPEYAWAYSIDAVLDQTEWPVPSHTLQSKTWEKIQKWEEQKALSASKSPVFLIFMQPSVFLLPCFVLFLCLGLTARAQYNATELRNQMDYNYFSSGPAYAYGTSSGAAFAR